MNSRFKHEIDLIQSIILEALQENYRSVKDVSIIRKGLVGRLDDDSWMQFHLVVEEILTPFRLKKLPKDFSTELTRKNLVKLVEILGE